MSCFVGVSRRSPYCSEEQLRCTAEKYYSTPNVVDLTSCAEERRFYYDDDGGAGDSKDPQTILPLTRVAPASPFAAECGMHPACRSQTTLGAEAAGAGKCDDGAAAVALACPCSSSSTARHPRSAGFADCGGAGRHQRTVLLVREHSVGGYDT